MVIELVTPILHQINTEKIPLDFDKPFGLSNVILETKNSDGCVLYANKELLAHVSHYFHKLVCEQKEEEQDGFIRIELDVDYAPMKEILRYVYNINRKYVKDTNPFSTDFDYPFSNFYFELFFSIGQTAKYLDFPLIWQQFYEGFINLPPCSEKLSTAVRLQLHAEKSAILRKMPLQHLRNYFSGNRDNSWHTFSFSDVFGLLKTIEYNRNNTGRR